MLSKVGLARLECPSCACISYLPARGLLQAAAVSCLRCYQAVAVADMEAKDPGLSRTLTILRQLAAARAAHRQRCDDAAGFSGTEQPASGAEVQLA